jgi:multiple sugar transport system permease protein
MKRPSPLRSALRLAATRGKLTEAAMAAPFFLLFSLFTLLPVAASIVLSLTDFDMIRPPSFLGFENYIRLFVEDDVFLIAVKNTLLFAFVTGPLSYFACLVFAWLINELRPGLRAALTLLFYAPSIAGNVFFIWIFIFSGDANGLVNSVLLRNGLIQDAVKWLTDPRYSLAIIMLVQLWLSLGVGFLSFIAGLQGIDGSIYEAGAIDGIRNRFQELVHLTLPSMGPMLLFGAVMQIASSFGVSAVCSALAGFPSTDYAAHTIVLHMQDYGTLRFEMGYASAIAVVLFLTMLLLKRGIGGILKRFAE